MPTVQEMLALRQKAVQDAKNSGAIEGNANAAELTDKDRAALAAMTPGTTEVGSSNTDTADKDASEYNPELAKDAVGVYAATFLQRFASEEGPFVHAIKGFFYAKNDSEAVILEHFASVGKVEKVEKK